MGYLFVFMMGFLLSGIWFGCHIFVQKWFAKGKMAGMEMFSPLISALVPTGIVLAAAGKAALHRFAGELDGMGDYSRRHSRNYLPDKNKTGAYGAKSPAGVQFVLEMCGGRVHGNTAEGNDADVSLLTAVMERPSFGDGDYSQCGGLGTLDYRAGGTVKTA